MENPKIKVKVVHSQSQSAWNIVGKKLGGKYKIARVPYIPSNNEELSEKNKTEAFQHAEFIAYCFNHSKAIINFKELLN